MIAVHNSAQTGVRMRFGLRTQPAYCAVRQNALSVLFNVHSSVRRPLLQISLLRLATPTRGKSVSRTGLRPCRTARTAASYSLLHMVLLLNSVAPCSSPFLARSLRSSKSQQQACGLTTRSSDGHPHRPLPRLLVKDVSVLSFCPGWNLEPKFSRNLRAEHAFVPLVCTLYLVLPKTCANS